MKKFIFSAISAILIPAIGHAQQANLEAYRDGSFSYREPVEIYWNDWGGAFFARSAEGQMVEIRAEGKTVGFNGIYVIDCSSDYSWFSSAKNWDRALNQNEVAQIVPFEVTSGARITFCELPAFKEYFGAGPMQERKYFQSKLKSRGYYNGSIDGAWGPGTATGVLRLLSYYRAAGIGYSIQNATEAQFFANDIIQNGVVVD